MHKLKPIFFHTEVVKDKLLEKNWCHYNSKRIQAGINETTVENIKGEWAKKQKHWIGYHRAHAINTSTKANKDAADAYMSWCNDNKFASWL